MERYVVPLRKEAKILTPQDHQTLFHNIEKVSRKNHYVNLYQGEGFSSKVTKSTLQLLESFLYLREALGNKTLVRSWVGKYGADLVGTLVGV